MEAGKKWLSKPLQVLGRYKYVLLVAVLGAALLLWPQSEGKETGGEGRSSGSSQGSVAETEQAMEEILSKISGVGRVDVMLTLESGGELVLAQDSTLRYSGNAQAPEDYQRSSDTVKDAGGVVVTREEYPRYRGALVVCDGGGNDAVRLEVIAAVSALTGLGADKISVVRWQAAGAA